MRQHGSDHARLSDVVDHRWSATVPDFWNPTRFGQLPGDLVDYTPTEPLLVVEVDADVCFEQHRWRHPTPFRRVRVELAPTDLSPPRIPSTKDPGLDRRLADALPHAIGASCAAPGRQVVSMSGDGGLTMLMGELLTAKEHERPITVVAFNNGSLGMIRLEMMVSGYPSFETDHGVADLAGIARAGGLEAITVEDPRKLRPALRAALDFPGPSLVDVRTDPNALSIPPHITATQVRGFALAATRTVLDGGVGRMIELARSNLRSIPRP